jgi:uncharacterized membrane-anchored protein
MTNKVGWMALAVLVSVGGAARADQKKGKRRAPAAAEESAPPAAQEPQRPEATKESTEPKETAEPGQSAQAQLPWKVGPADVPLGHDVTIALPAGFTYLDPASSAKVLEQMGNFHNEGVLGIVAPMDDARPYFVVIDFDESGMVKDDDELDSDEILETLRSGQEKANEERTQRGFKPLFIDGWAEPPRYEQARHHLVWAVNLHDDDGKTINFPTRVLGRRGYVMLNLVVDPEHFAASKSDMPQLLAATTFAPGARYEDFNASTDKVATYGLVALITGGVAAKVGILAKLWGVIVAAVIALKKLLIIAFIALGALVKRLMGRRRRDELAVEAAPAAPSPGDGTD